jgi:hypothetical protein
VIQVGQAFFAGNDLAARRKDRRNAHQVLRGDACIPQGQLKGGQPLLVFTNALGEEELLRDHAFSQFLCTLRGILKMADFLKRSRMSLSHPAGLEQPWAQFHLRFTS